MSDEKNRKRAYREIVDAIRARREPSPNDAVEAEIERIVAVMEAAAALPTVDGSNGVSP